jgi:hypothetical protein
LEGSKERAKLDRKATDIFSRNIVKWCIWAVVFAAPFSKSISEIGITAAIIAWFMWKVVNRDFRLERSSLLAPFIIFLLSVIPSFFNTLYPDLSARAFFTKILKYAVFYFVIYETIDTKAKAKDLLVMALLSAGIVMADGFTQYWCGADGLHYPGYPSFKYRTHIDDAGFFRGFPTACFPYPNDLAAWILLVFFPITSAVLFDLKKSGARYMAATVSLGLFCLFTLAKVRSAWIAMALSVIYIVISKRKLWLLVILVLAIAIPYLLKMEMAQYTFNLSSLSDRLSMLGTSWEIFMNHPIIGNGINTFFRNYQELRNDQWKGRKGSYAHNCYLQMAADTGIVGLAGFTWLMAAYFMNIIKKLRRIRDPFFGPVLWGMSIGIFAFLVHSAFDTNLYSLNLATLFWTSIAISQAIIKVCDEEAARI